MMDSARGERACRAAQEFRSTRQTDTGVNRVEGNLGRRKPHQGVAAHEALGMSPIRSIERPLASGGELGDATEEHVRGREERELRMAVAMRVPLEELAHPAAIVADAVEATGIVRLVLHRLEACFRKRVVVRDARPRGPVFALGTEVSSRPVAQRLLTRRDLGAGLAR